MLKHTTRLILTALLIFAQSAVAGVYAQNNGNAWLEQLGTLGSLGRILASASSGYYTSLTAAGGYGDDDEDEGDSETEPQLFLDFDDINPGYAEDDDEGDSEEEDDAGIEPCEAELYALALLKEGNRVLALEKIKECYDSGNVSKEGHRTFIALVFGTETEASLVQTKFWPARKNTAKAVAAILATDLPTSQERAALLALLIGTQETEGLAADSSEIVRSAVAKAIRKILLKKTLDPSEEATLIKTLIGSKNIETGLSDDRHFGVRAAVAKAIGKILSAGALSDKHKDALLAVLAGEPNPYFGLGSDHNAEVRVAAARAIGSILINTSPNPSALERLTQALIGSNHYKGLCDDWDIIVVMEVIKAAGNILAKDAVPANERTAFIELLLSPGTQEGFLYSRHAFMRRKVLEAIYKILITGLPDEAETTLLFDALISFLDDTDSKNRGRLAEVMGDILGTNVLTPDQRVTFIAALMKRATKDPVENVRTLAMIEIEWLLRSAYVKDDQ